MDNNEALNRLLTFSCSNPVDYLEFEAWAKQEQPKPFDERLSFTGWSKYEIRLCCASFTVIARQTGSVHNDDGFDYCTYEVKEMIRL